jgi:hypothetical protein
MMTATFTPYGSSQEVRPWNRNDSVKVNHGKLLVFIWMRIWIGLLSLSAGISSTSDIIRRGLTAIGSQQQKVGGHTSAMSCDVWSVGESIDNALTGRMVYS